MNYSAILVVAHPGKLECAIKALSALPGIEVHQRDTSTDRVICTIEAIDTNEAVQRFQSVSELETVRDVSLIEDRPNLDRSIP